MIVDPTVLGGVVTQIGDTVIDGSVRHRLDQLRESVRPQLTARRGRATHG